MMHINSASAAAGVKMVPFSSMSSMIASAPNANKFHMNRGSIMTMASKRTVTNMLVGDAGQNRYGNLGSTVSSSMMGQQIAVGKKSVMGPAFAANQFVRDIGARSAQTVMAAAAGGAWDQETVKRLE
jgi:hypothetical protein